MLAEKEWLPAWPKLPECVKSPDTFRHKKRAAVVPLLYAMYPPPGTLGEQLTVQSGPE